MVESPTEATGEAAFSVRFWGVRGSIAVSGPDTVRYGGNTSCLEVRCGGRLLIFDGGTGIRYLGNRLMQAGGPVDGDLFFTHMHFDHVCGIPFFRPFFVRGNSFRLWAGHLRPKRDLKTVLEEMMIEPLFPISPAIFAADLDYRDYSCGETLTPAPGVAVRTASLNHPNGACGYRIDYGGRSICYLTDTEHVADRLDANILGLIQGADIVIYDSMYTDEEYPSRKGWGHSTWREGARLCDAAGAKTFVIFHHDPDHDDAFMDAIAAEAEQRRPGTVVAREGLVLTP
jgi:phosphoribosyl 1,2-cyclic phosphodiesterase